MPSLIACCLAAATINALSTSDHHIAVHCCGHLRLNHGLIGSPPLTGRYWAHYSHSHVVSHVSILKYATGADWFHYAANIFPVQGHSWIYLLIRGQRWCSHFLYISG